MLKRPIIFLVDWCWTHARLVAALYLLASTVLGWYAVTHFDLDTDQSHMISSSLPFRLAEQALDSAFPQNTDQLVAVIDAATPAEAEAAVEKLRARLEPRTDLFRLVRRPPEEMLFRSHGMLFLSPEELTALSDQLTAAQPMIGAMARDPSLRGFLSALDLAIVGVEHGQIDEASITPLIDQLDKPVSALIKGRAPAPVSWSGLAGAAAEHDKPQRILLTQPKLSFDALVAADGPTTAIREAASDLGVKLRLTGPVALADANFASVSQGTVVNGSLMVLAVIGLIWFAVRSKRIVTAIVLSLISGLMLTMFFAVMAVRSLNPISIAFAVMFVGIAVDFAIQFVVRFRHEQQLSDDPHCVLKATARETAAPLTLAAIATAVGFLSFVPTDYSGVSQLGLIAGGGMVIALFVDFTLLPALLALLEPKRKEAPMSLSWGPADAWLARNGKAVVAALLAAGLAGFALLPQLPLDFNPLHLLSARDESVSAFQDLGADPDNGVFAADLLGSRDDLAQLERECDSRPEFLRCLSLADFAPDHQEDKLAIIADLASLLGPTLEPAETLAPPDAEALRASLREAASRLGERPLAAKLRALADKDDQAILALQSSLTGGLPDMLGQLRAMLKVEPIAAKDLSPELIANWRAADGQERLQVMPKGDMNDDIQRKAFVKAVRGLADGVALAAGVPINIEGSGKVVVRAFTQAGIAALAAIFLMLWFMLRRVRDAALVLLPLVIGASLTVIGCVVFGLAINFANIIALPLLLGIGVAFNIYFVINWRYGVTTPLQSPTTRAVLFSALTTGTAFGSLAASPHIGTASMGLLLFLSLGLSVITTFLLLPALFAVMGPRGQ